MKVVIPFLLALMLSFNCFAQKFEAKIIGGVNGGQLDGDGMSGWHKLGLLAGLGVRYHLNERVFLQPEVLYSMKGSQTSDAEQKQGFPYIVYDLRYIELPLVIGYQITDVFSAQAGLTPNYLLSAKLDNGTNLGFVDKRFFFNDFDFTMNIGLEWELTNAFSVHSRYSYSAVSISKGDLSQLNFSTTVFAANLARPGMYTNTLSFSIRYTIGGKNIPSLQGPN